jgi:hypothetical protein
MDEEISQILIKMKQKVKFLHFMLPARPRSMLGASFECYNLACKQTRFKYNRENLVLY